MPIHILKKIEDKARDIAMSLDYGLYSIINLFKFKRFPRNIKKILIVEMLKIGDILVATPTINAIKNTFKNVSIDALIIPETKNILKNNKDINKIITYKAFKETKKELKKQKYDLAIILHPGSFKISLLLLLSKIKYRLGCTKSGITYGKGFFLNKKIKPNNKWQHKIEDNLDVIRSIGIKPTNKNIRIETTKQAENKVKKLLKNAKGKIIGIHTYSNHKSQRWIPERFAKVADHLIKKYSCSIVFTGTDEEAGYINHMINLTKNKNKIINSAGKTDLEEFIALIKKLNLLISVDTSAIHIASGTKTPTIGLFGPTIPIIWGPSNKNSTYIWKNNICIGCRKYFCIFNKNYECMKAISIENVLEKAERLLK